VSKPVAVAVAGAALVAAAAIVLLFFRPSSPHSAQGGPIEYVVQVRRNGSRLLTWADSSTRRRRTLERRAGVPTEVESVENLQAGQLTIYTIDLLRRQWSSETISVTGATFDDPAKLGQTIRRQVASGRFHVVGRGVIAGRAAVHLRRFVTNPHTVAGFIRTLPVDEWVDASTYLPLRIKEVGGLTQSVSTYRWLPRTSANLAKLDVALPAGFHSTG
jgi:hypothetical protein